METIQVESGTPYQDIQVRLEDRDFNLLLSWNFRREVWALNVLDADREQLYSISSLLVGAYPGILNSHNPEYLSGSFMVLDSANGNTDASLDSLGANHLLVYFTAEEMIETLNL